MSWIADLLKEYPAVAVVKERLELAEARHELTSAKNAELQLQADELTKEVARLRAELAEIKSLEEYEHREGLLWKKDGSGPFCPKCKGSMVLFGPRRRCPVCAVVG